MPSPLVTMLKESCPPKPTWGVDDIPDLTGKVTIVTGGNTGIGRETVKALMQHNAKVYLAARSAAKAQEAIEALKKETGKDNVHFLQLDLADLSTIKRSVDDFTSRESQLHILFNNAGVMWPSIDLLTAQGYDLQFGTNVLGHYCFTKLLLPTLQSTATASGQKVRIVETSSDGNLHNKTKELIDYTAMRDAPQRTKLGSHQMYYMSKSGNILVTKARARMLEDLGIISITLNPGHIQTDLQRHISTPGAELIGKLFLNPAPMGAINQLYAGTAPEGERLNGQYLIPWHRIGTYRDGHDEIETQDMLIAWLDEQVQPFMA